MQDIKKTLIVAKYTFVEIYRSRIFLNIIILGIALLVVCYVASELTYGVPTKIILDFGLGITSLASVAIAIFMGVGLISNELESRTVYMVLSRPISRYSFLLGKIIGMMLILGINIFFLSGLTLVLFGYLSGEFSSLLFWAPLFITLEVFVVLLATILVSLLANPVVTVITTLLIYILGHSVNDALLIKFVQERPLLEWVIEVYSTIMPDFAKLNLKDYLIYQHFLPWDYLMRMSLYGLCYCMILLVISFYCFKRKNLD